MPVCPVIPEISEGKEDMRTFKMAKRNIAIEIYMN